MANLSLLQARAVDAIKRSALARLHRSVKGEALVLQAYLGLEEHAEQSLLEEACAQPLPPWLKEQLARHSADEARHALMLRNRITKLGLAAVPRKTDPLNRWKVSRFRELVEASSKRFAAGRVVPVLAVLWRAEVMGLRVFQRHAEVLRVSAPDHGRPTLAILERVLEDERRHEESCRSALERLVEPSERGAFEALIEGIDAIERAWSISGAVAMWFAGVLTGVRGRPSA